jgi:hypothetical protein
VTLTKRRTVCKTAYLRLWSVLGVRVNNRHVLCYPLYISLLLWKEGRVTCFSSSIQGGSDEHLAQMMLGSIYHSQSKSKASLLYVNVGVF